MMEVQNTQKVVTVVLVHDSLSLMPHLFISYLLNRLLLRLSGQAA